MSLRSHVGMENESFEKGEQKERVEREFQGPTNEKDEAEIKDKAEIEEKERERKWQMAYTARMREIIPGLVLGNVEASHNRGMLRENGIKAIISLTNVQMGRWYHTREVGILENRHKWVQCVDSSTQDLLVYMSDMCDFIDEMASPSLQASSSFPSDEKPDPNIQKRQDTVASEAVLVHCDLGISRSPTVIIAYLMRKFSAKLEDVLAFVQTKQRVKPNTNFIRQLQVWEQTGYQI
jgi:dual specificity phosphatase 12